MMYSSVLYLFCLIYPWRFVNNTFTIYWIFLLFRWSTILPNVNKHFSGSKPQVQLETNENTETFLRNQATSTSPMLFPSFDGSLFFPVSDGNIDSTDNNKKVALKKLSVTSPEIVLFIIHESIFFINPCFVHISSICLRAIWLSFFFLYLFFHENLSYAEILIVFFYSFTYFRDIYLSLSLYHIDKNT